MLTVWMLGAPCPPSPPAGPTGPDSDWVSVEQADSALGRLRLASAASGAGECEVALAALGRWSGACEGSACEQGAEQAAQIEERCLVDASGLAVPDGGRVAADVEAPPGRVVVGRRMLTYILADGRRFTRPLCVRRGAPPEVAFDALDAPLAPLEDDAGARASALAAQARAYARREAWCETATLYEALAELTELPAARYNAALAHAEREGGCRDAGAAFEAVVADAPSDAIYESARERLERLRESCTATLVVVGLSSRARVRIDGSPPADFNVISGGLPCMQIDTLVTELWPGARRVELHEAGRPPVVTWVPIGAGDDARARAPADWWEFLPPLGPSSSTPPPSPPEETLGWLWAPVAATGLGLTAGVVFTVLAEGDLDAHAQAARDAQRDPSRSYLADQRAALDDFDRDRAIAYVGWGLAAAGAAVFAVGWALDDVEGEVVATGDGLRVEGRF